jgi:hypothetical protein
VAREFAGVYRRYGRTRETPRRPVKYILCRLTGLVLRAILKNQKNRPPALFCEPRRGDATSWFIVHGKQSISTRGCKHRSLPGFFSPKHSAGDALDEGPSWGELKSPLGLLPRQRRLNTPYITKSGQWGPFSPLQGLAFLNRGT